jgi:hypothetical protein
LRDTEIDFHSSGPTPPRPIAARAIRAITYDEGRSLQRGGIGLNGRTLSRFAKGPFIGPSRHASSQVVCESPIFGGVSSMETVRDALDCAYVDTIDVCQLKCPTCVRGLRVLENSSAKMSLEQFKEIANKLKVEGYNKIGLFNWTEPFLNRTLQDYVAEVKKHDLPCWISSTFSLRHIDNLEATLVAGADLIIVSMSGMDQETYETNHVGGDLAYALQNLRLAADIVRRFGLPTVIRMRFIRFDYNAHHIDPAQAFARDLGIDFEVIKGGGNPFDSDLAGHTDRFFRDHIATADSQTSQEACGKTCGLMFDQIAIDCKGDIYICCAMPTHPSLRIGRYLDLTADEILLRRYVHSFCRSCNMPRRDASQSDKARLYRAISSSVRGTARN